MNKSILNRKMQRTTETDFLEPLEPQHFPDPNSYVAKIKKVSKPCLYVPFILHSLPPTLSQKDGLVAVLQ